MIIDLDRLSTDRLSALESRNQRWIRSLFAAMKSPPPSLVEELSDDLKAIQSELDRRTIEH